MAKQAEDTLDLMTNENQLNTDLTRILAIDTGEMDWAPSPAPGVMRKRLFRNGPAESGRVTSLVSYAPGSQFPSHPHPEGEEIYVLSGVFSDARGDWPAGSYLLNPEGFVHSPGSAPGCELFVRLRQAPGTDRHQVGMLVAEQQWRADKTMDHCALWSQAGHEDVMRLERWHNASELAARDAPLGFEYLILEGSLALGEREYGQYSFFRVPANQCLPVTSSEAVTLLVREGGFALMQ